MDKIKKRLPRIIGLGATIYLIGAFINDPSFPTPDKLIVFMLFLFMIFGQATEMLKRFGAFVVILLVYESFRSVADQLNSHVNYSFAPFMDKLLFGNLPTVYLQNWLWRGHTSWYDIVLYLPYMLHFIIPFGFGILVWKKAEKHFWKVICAFCVSAFGAFATFLIFPAAPPWMASDNHYIQPIAHISSNVWYSLGLHDFPSFYNHITPNLVAAVPSLHAAWAALFSIFVFKVFGRRYGCISLLYPALIFLGTVYEGEHYAFDLILGVAYALGSYWLAPYVLRLLKRIYLRFSKPIKAKRLRIFAKTD